MKDEQACTTEIEQQGENELSVLFHIRDGT